VVQAYIDISSFIAEFKERLRRMFPELETIYELMKDMAARTYTISQVTHIIETLKTVVSGLITTVQTNITKYVLDRVDIFSLLAHPIQDCQPENETWWWFDTLHYRQTGEFATKLLARGQGNDPVMAYAVGYLSHIAADAVGHPYVNSIVRGPYRTHAQRHKVVENFQDVWAYNHYIGGELSTSRFHERVRLTRNREIDLPNAISEAISAATEQTYRRRYGVLEPVDIEAAYRLWYTWFRNVTETGTLEPELPNYVPPDNPTREAIKNLLEELGDVGDSLSGSKFSLKGLVNFFKELGESILSALLVALSALDYLLGVLLSIPLKVLYGLLSLIYQAIYNAYENYRLLVATLGFAYPLQHHLQRPILSHLTDPTQADATGRTVNPQWPYPMQAIPKGDATGVRFPPEFAGLESTAHLIYPPSGEEKPPATVAPEEYLTHTADYYITGPIDPSSVDIRNLNEIDEERFRPSFGANSTIGNAVDLTVELLCNYLNDDVPIPDLNLDGDRGFSFPPWTPEECGAVERLSTPVTPRKVS
jgi:hypothetical protein